MEQNLLRVEQRVRSHLHTFQGRCWDNIRFHFHTCKLLCRQFRSVDNCLSVSTPGIAAFFPRCTLEIRFLHIYKCKGVETLFWTMIYYKHVNIFITFGALSTSVGTNFDNVWVATVGVSLHTKFFFVPACTCNYSISKTFTPGNIIFRNFIGSIFFPLKLP